MGGQGFRVVVHVGAERKGIATIRVTGLTSTLPTLPAKALPFVGFTLDAQFLRTTAARVKEAFALSEYDEVAELGIHLEAAPARRGSGRRLAAGTLALAKTAPGKGAPPDALSYALVGRLTANGRLPELPLAKTVLVANQQAPVFIQDPMTS